MEKLMNYAPECELYYQNSPLDGKYKMYNLKV